MRLFETNKVLLMIHGFASEVLITLVIKFHIISDVARRTNEEKALMSKNLVSLNLMILHFRCYR